MGGGGAGAMGTLMGVTGFGRTCAMGGMGLGKKADPGLPYQSILKATLLPCPKHPCCCVLRGKLSH